MVAEWYKERIQKEALHLVFWLSLVVLILALVTSAIAGDLGFGALIACLGMPIVSAGYTAYTKWLLNKYTTKLSADTLEKVVGGTKLLYCPPGNQGLWLVAFKDTDIQRMNSGSRVVVYFRVLKTLLPKESSAMAPYLWAPLDALYLYTE